MKIKINYELVSPLSHIGETASTGSIFQTIQTAGGRIPVVTGNSVRGTLRDRAAETLLKTLGIKVNKTVFNVLFSGGNLSGASKNDVARTREIRRLFPFVSVFGGGVGSMILQGKMRCGFCYPVCKEAEYITGEKSEKSWREMIDEMDFTRMDDTKNDKLNKYVEDMDAEAAGTATTQMRYTVQYLAPGTKLKQEIDVDGSATPEEIGALVNAIKEWFKNPYMGGMANKGFGKFKASARFELSEDEKEYLRTDGEYNSPTLCELEDAYLKAVGENGCEAHLDLLGK